MATLNQRWEAWCDREDRSSDEFALRADGKIVIFDAPGSWFVVGWEDDTIYAWDAYGHWADIYCEPVWLASYYDHFLEMLRRD